MPRQAPLQHLGQQRGGTASYTQVVSMNSALNVYFLEVGWIFHVQITKESAGINEVATSPPCEAFTGLHLGKGRCWVLRGCWVYGFSHYYTSYVNQTWSLKNKKLPRPGRCGKHTSPHSGTHILL